MDKKPNRFAVALQDARHFIDEELWTRDTATLPALRRFLFSLCRIVMIVVKGFTGDNCSLHASALTYITLVSLVPMLAIMFSFSKGLGMQRKILETLGIERIRHFDPETMQRSFEFRIIDAKQTPNDEQATPPPEPQTPDAPEPPEPPETPETPETPEPPAPTPDASPDATPPPLLTNPSRPLRPGLASRLPEPMQEALVRMFVYVENTSFAALGLIGSLMLFVSVIVSMEKLERTMNLIWGVKTARPWLRKVSDYLVVLLMIPIVFLVATSMNTLIVSNSVIDYMLRHWGSLALVLEWLMKLIGAIFIMMGFSLFYMLMPNTRVKLFPSMVAGLIAGILWFAVQWAYMSLQVGLTNFNKIYGTFAVVPFFLAWLYANWSIVLFGAEVSFAIQNHRTIHIEKASESASTGVCIVIAHLILFETCRAFKEGKGGWSPEDYAQEHNIPTRVLQHVIAILEKAKILIRANTPSDEPNRYLPGRDTDDLNPADVEEAFRETQSLDTQMYLRDLPPALREHFTQQYESYRQSLAKLNFGSLVSPPP